MTLAAVMPLPEGVSELAFAGALGGRRVRLAEQKGWPLPVHADADFCLLAEVDPDVRKPEGPFGDHLGYYSLAHSFPVLRVRRIYHRAEAIWPFTVVGRWTLRECTRCCSPWAASATCRSKSGKSRRNCSPKPTPSWDRASSP